MLKRRKKLVHGVGVNDADYEVQQYQRIDGKQKAGWCCPFYRKWTNMLARCYSEAVQLKQITYVGCSAVVEWHLFSNFKSWMQTQDWEGKQLDKDILILGNREYGPETCVFVDAKVNIFLTEGKAGRGEFPIGVSFHKKSKKYRAKCGSVETGGPVSIGYFSTPEEAHQAWLSFKLRQAYILAGQQTDERVAKALIDRYENYTLS